MVLPRSEPLAMNDGHQLHEARVEGGAEPSGAFTVEPRPAPAGICLVELSGELDVAATASVRSCVDEAAGTRGLVLDLSGATFLDSSMLKELLRANAELARCDTPLVLAGIPPAVRRVLDLTRTAELFTLADDRAEGVAIVDR